MTNEEIINQNTTKPASTQTESTKQATLTQPKKESSKPTINNNGNSNNNSNNSNNSTNINTGSTDNKGPKILVASPTFGRYSIYLDEYLKGIEAIDYNNGSLVLVDYSKDNAYSTLLKHKGIMVLKGPGTDNSKENIMHSRNLIRNFFLKGDYDYLLSLEQNMIPSPNVIKQLLSHNKEIVGAYYAKPVKLNLEHAQTKEVTQKVIELPPMTLFTDGGKIVQANAKDLLNKGLTKVATTELGCLLIKRNVLENISFRLDPETRQTEETLFCLDATKFGHEVYIDGNLTLKYYSRIEQK